MADRPSTRVATRATNNNLRSNDSTVLHKLQIHDSPTSKLLSSSLMADRPSTRVATRATNNNLRSNDSTVLHKLQIHAANSTQLMGILTFLISSSILLFLTGVVVTLTVLGLIFFTPLLIVSSPIWVPMGTVLFIVTSGFLLLCGLGFAAVGGLSRVYKYFRGMRVLRSDSLDYARTRAYDKASHAQDYGREYGRYLQSKVKDAAPSA